MKWMTIAVILTLMLLEAPLLFGKDQPQEGDKEQHEYTVLSVQPRPQANGATQTTEDK